jgi:hypothetical protein
MSESGKAVFLSYASPSFAVFDRLRASEGRPDAISENFL